MGREDVADGDDTFDRVARFPLRLGHTSTASPRSRSRILPWRGVDGDHVDLDAEQVRESEAEADLVKQEGLVGELHEEVEVRPRLVLSPGDGAEDAGGDGVVLGRQRSDRVPVLLDP